MKSSGGDASIAEHARTAAIFVAAVVLMSLRPVLLHAAHHAGAGEVAMDSRCFLLLSETLKVLICGSALCWRRSALGPEHAHLWHGARHTVAFAPPAVTYLVMNGFFVYWNKRVSPPMWQLLANMKIMTTAIMGRAVLSRPLRPLQWGALLLLTVAMVLGTWAGEVEGQSVEVAGFAACFFCCVLSSLGAVLTERLLKSRGSMDLSIFATNVHMASHTVLFNVAALLMSPVVIGSELPPLPTLNTPTLLALANEALSGILLSQIMRFADSNVKNYAFCISVFTTLGFSALLFQYSPRPGFYVGALLVVVSMAMYTRDVQIKPPKTD